MRVAHDGKVGVTYATAFLYSDWLYFLWHGHELEIKMCGVVIKNPPFNSKKPCGLPFPIKESK